MLYSTLAADMLYSSHIGCRPAPPTAYVSIRPHTSAYVSIRQHTAAYVTYVVEDFDGRPLHPEDIARMRVLSLVLVLKPLHY